MAAKTQYPIDSKRLLSLLRSNQNTRRYSTRQLSALLGYSDARTLDDALKRNSITSKMLDSLASFGIMYEDYIGAEKKQTNISESHVCSGSIDLDELKMIIYEAVLNGVKDALK